MHLPSTAFPIRRGILKDLVWYQMKFLKSPLSFSLNTIIATS